ncbi:hypothetical protein D3C72_1768210 [compost metagenome]
MELADLETLLEVRHPVAAPLGRLLEDLAEVAGLRLLEVRAQLVQAHALAPGVGTEEVPRRLERELVGVEIPRDGVGDALRPGRKAREQARLAIGEAHELPAQGEVGVVEAILLVEHGHQGGPSFERQ